MEGEELRALRVEAGYKSKDLADLLGITATTMSRYERGRLPIPKLVQYASRYVCETQLARPSPGDRLVSVLREVLNEESGER